MLATLYTLAVFAQAGAGGKEKKEGGADSGLDITPDATNAPGADALSDILNGLATYALLFAGVGFLLGAATWAIGGRISNDHAASGGKVGMVVCFAVAFLVGAASVILNFAFKTGSAA